MERDFDLWNNLKKEIGMSLDNLSKFPKFGEVWMVILGKNIGSEQNGSGSNFSRPILVIKKFNNGMFWGIPLSTKQKNFDFYFNYIDPQGQKVSLIIAQLKLISIKRFIRKMYDLDAFVVEDVRLKLKSFL